MICLQAIVLRWPLNNPVEVLFIKSIVLRGYAESKMIDAPVSILLQLASPCVVETAPKAQAKTTWWHNVVDHWIDVLVSPQSTGGHAHLVLWVAEAWSQIVFHNLLGCMELLPGLHAVFAIPNMNALPVHCANQVWDISSGLFSWDIRFRQKYFKSILGYSWDFLI